MKRKEIFQSLISTMQKELPFSVLDREMQLPVNSGQIITVTGVRRCGKSSMLKIAANKLVESGVDPDRILWINFDDERLDSMDASELDEIIQAYREMFPATDIASIHIFFDEIQLIDRWELFVIRLYKTYCKNIYISGSNAKMLSSQLATALRGWPLEFEAFPLSFGEYLHFKGIELSKYDERDRAALVALSREYLHASSFPEVVLMSEESLKIRKVQGYFNTMLYRDLIEHYELPNTETVKYCLKRMMLNLTKPTSMNVIFNDIKSQGRKADKNMLYELADMSTNTYMFYRVNKWSTSLIKENSRLPKYYCIDNGMRNAVIMPQSDDNGKLLENAVFLQLRRHLNPLHKITYFGEECECDFVIQFDEHIDSLIQVCWSISDPDTRTRELRGIKTAALTTGCRNCCIVTFDEEETLTYDDITVKVIPLWKFLLE